MRWRAALSCVVVLVGCGGPDPGVSGGTAGNGTTGTSQPTGTGGAATQAGGGQGSGAGAGGHAGLSTGSGTAGDAGRSSGGALGSAGSGGAGRGGAGPSSKGGATSVPEECLRPYICVDTCGGEEQNFGCQPCPEGRIDTIYCPAKDATTGLFGTVNFLEGNHQPTTGVITGTTTPVAREIRFYGPVTSDLVDPATGQNAYKQLYSTVRANLRAKAYSGMDGKYMVTMRPGKYSAFVKDGDDWYCNRAQSDGLCLVEVPATGTLEYDIDITYAASF
ncbi:MAG TPA: hypothetical protein VFK05_20915 [Polyangiaceae bacterium]|nr:hypothetical protein [Polyangiaceae bacterium]